MMAAGVPVVPGSKEPVYTVEEGLKTAKEVGFPVMIKRPAAAAERECAFEVGGRFRGELLKCPDGIRQGIFR